MQAQADPGATRKRRASAGRVIAFAVVAGGSGYVLGTIGRTELPGGVRAALEALTAWDLLLLPLAMLGVLAVHEAGHLLGGLSRGMRFLMYIVGPFAWFRGAQGIHFRWLWSLSTFGGLAAAIPAPDQPLRPQLLRLVLGGPAASLLLAALGFAALALFPGRPGAYGLIIGGMSLAIFLVTSAPMQTGGFMSDGMQFLQLTRNPAAVDRRVRLMALMGEGLAGTRPRDYHRQALAQAQALTGDEPLYDVSVWLCQYFHALDSGDIPAAGAWLDRVAATHDSYPAGFRQTLAIELALFEAMHRQRADLAATWLASARGGVADDSRRSLAQAAVALAQRRPDAALSALELAERRLGRSMDAGLALLSRDQMQALRQAIAAGS